MQRVRRRVVGAFVHLLMLHLLLVGSGDACLLRAVAGAARGASAAAVGAAGRVTATDDTALASHSVPSHGRGCDGEGGPPPRHDQPSPSCQSMAPCAPAALAATPATVERPTTLLLAAGPVAAVVLAPASRSSAPEPPPPRA